MIEIVFFQTPAHSCIVASLTTSCAFDAFCRANFPILYEETVYTIFLGSCYTISYVFDFFFFYIYRLHLTLKLCLHHLIRNHLVYFDYYLPFSMFSINKSFTYFICGIK
uniref:Uncharacterized protein n=1 Tax=Lepeophtheirus salmonis TaxID=72036 RepID=A0A0K2U905_LEPSM